jgi:DNA-binding protein HU-beta
MNKADIVDVIADQCEITKAKSSEIIEAMIELVTFELGHGGEVRLAGFGKFKTDHKEATTARNPRTGEPIDVAAKTVVKFKPEKALRDAANRPLRKVGTDRLSPLPEQKRA